MMWKTQVCSLAVALAGCALSSSTSAAPSEAPAEGTFGQEIASAEKASASQRQNSFLVKALGRGLTNLDTTDKVYPSAGSTSR